MLGAAVDQHEDEHWQEVIGAGWGILRVPQGGHQVGGAFGDAMELVLRRFLGIHGPQFCTTQYRAAWEFVVGMEVLIRGQTFPSKVYQPCMLLCMHKGRLYRTS